MKLFLGTSCMLLLLFLCQVSYGQIPHMLSYQGVLTDTSGAPKADGNYHLTFRLYDAEMDGSALWAESKTLPVKGGLFATQLGDAVPFGPSVKFDKRYWLSMQVDAQPELYPRLALSAVAYSLNSPVADSARVAGTVPNSSITSAKIANGTIQLADLAQNGAAEGHVLKWSSGIWTTAADEVGGGSGSAGGWTDNGAVVGLTAASDTVSINSTSHMGKLNVGGNIGLNSNSKLYFGTTIAQLGSLGGNMSATAEGFTFARDGEASWARIDNTTKEVGIGTVTMDDRLHVKNDADAPCWIRVETSHPTLWGQAGLRIKTPQNMWNMRMDLHGNANLPNGALSLHSQDVNKEVMTWLEDGRVGIGIKDPIRKLHVNGSAEVEDTLYAGTINAGKIVNGPGVVHASKGGNNKMPGVTSVFDSITVNAPGPGYALVIFSGGLYASHDYNDQAYVHVHISTTSDITGALATTEWILSYTAPSGGYGSPLALQTIATIPSRSSRKYYIVVERSDPPSGFDQDDIYLYNGSFSALFVPASYGTVEAAPPPPPAKWAPSEIAVQSEEPQSSESSLKSEVEALKMELQALKNELTLRAK